MPIFASEASHEETGDISNSATFDPTMKKPPRFAQGGLVFADSAPVSNGSED
jgi:hypothetical protein